MNERSCTSSSSSSGDQDVFDFESGGDAEIPGGSSQPAMNRGREREEDNVFDTSNTTQEGSGVDGVRSSAVSSSATSVNDENESGLSANLPVGCIEIAKQGAGTLYIERYESFIRNNWPYDLKRGNLCHPRALALAGLKFNSLEPEPSAQCIVCLTVIPMPSANCNPWQLHVEACPTCYFVKLGQRDKPDDYDISQVMEMIYTKISNETDEILKNKQNLLKRQLLGLRHHANSVRSQRN